MARLEIPFIVANSAGAPQGGATVQIVIRGSGGTPATIFAQEEGPDTLSNPLTTTANGRVDGWLDEGRYSITVSGAGLTTYTQHWDSTSGGPVTRNGDAALGNTGPAAQGGIALGPALDSLVYRSAATEVRTNSTFIIDGAARVGQARLIGTPSSLAIQDSGSAGLLKSGLVASQFTDNINAVRTELGNNTTNNDATFTGLTGVALRRIGFGAIGSIFANAVSGAIPIPAADSLVVAYAGGRDTLNLSSTAADTGITIGGDVELYRSAANVLTTPDTVNAVAFQQGGVALASTHLADTANIVRLDAVQTIAGAKTFTASTLFNNDVNVRQAGDTFARVNLNTTGVLNFGTGAAAADTNLFRNGANELRTNDTFRADGTISAAFGTVDDTGIGAIGPASEAAIKLGLDVTIYRSVADTFRTSDSGVIDANLLLGTTTARGKLTLATSTVVGGGISFGDSITPRTDRVDLYRSALGVVTLDGSAIVNAALTVSGATSLAATTATGTVTASSAAAGQVRIGNAAGDATIFFGTAEDTSLRRSAAATLRTASALIVDGYLTANAGLLTTGASSFFRRTLATDEAVGVQVGTITRHRILADGQHDWADATGVVDTTLTRTSAAVLRLTGTFNATVGYQVGGAALASTHLSDTATLIRNTSAAGGHLAGTYPNPTIANNVVTNAHIATTAAIADTKLATITTAGKVAESAVDTAIARLASPVFTGTPSAPTPASSTNSGQIATTAFVQALVSGGGTAPVTSSFATMSLSGTGKSVLSFLDTTTTTGLTIGNDTNLYRNTAGVLKTDGSLIVGASLSVTGGATFTGTPTGPTAVADTDTTQLATTAFIIGQAGTLAPIVDGAATIGASLRYARQDHIHPTDTSRAPVNAPSFTGVASAFTPAADTNTTQLATTAYVISQAGTLTPIIDGAAAVGTSLRYARQDHIHPVDASRQAADADLAALAALTTTGLAARNAADTWVTRTILGDAEVVVANGSGVAGNPALSIGASIARLASPALTGTPTAPTAAVDTNTTQLATASFVLGQRGAAAPLMNGAAASGTSFRYAPQDHVHPIDTSRAPLASPAFTGTPTAPTPAAGTNTNQLATTDFVNAAVEAARAGLDIKASVRVATTGNVNLAAGGAQTIDGVALVAGDRVLVKSQSVALENGIYVVAAGAWTRASDADASAEVTSGLFTWVSQGTVNADTGWVLTTDDPITLGTTALAFAQFNGLGQVVAGDGLTKTANTLDVVGTTNRILVNADSIDIASTYAGQPSLTTLGTITTGVWNGSTIGVGYIDLAIARLASPTFTGNPGAPTPPQDDNDTSIATTAFVLGQLSNTSPLVDGTATSGGSFRFSRADHVHPSDTSRAPAAGSSSITSLGAVTSGAWNAAVIGASYIDNTIARLASPSFVGTVTIPTLSVTGPTTLNSTLNVTGGVGALGSLTAQAGFFALGRTALTDGGTTNLLSFFGGPANSRTGRDYSMSNPGQRSMNITTGTLQDALNVLATLVGDLRAYGLLG